MIGAVKVRNWPATLAVLAIAVAACGRSEQIGWADREMPDSVAVRATAEPAAGQSQPTTGSGSALMDEYERLARSLAQVRARAMQNPDLSAEWSVLNDAVEERLLGVSSVYRQLANRRAALEKEIDEAMESGQDLDADKRAELSQFYRNVQYDLTRMRSMELQKPEYSDRLQAFQERVYAKMRELLPGRIIEINRMEELESQLFVPTDTLPPIPGLGARG